MAVEEGDNDDDYDDDKGRNVRSWKTYVQVSVN
jgi:hypothetical protein